MDLLAVLGLIAPIGGGLAWFALAYPAAFRDSLFPTLVALSVSADIGLSIWGLGARQTFGLLMPLIDAANLHTAQAIVDTVGVSPLTSLLYTVGTIAYLWILQWLAGRAMDKRAALPDVRRD